MRRGSLDPIVLQGIFVGWNRRVPHGIKIATFRDDGEVEEVFTSTTRDTVFPLFGDAGTRSAIEAELQRFGESVRARPDEAEGPSLALRRPAVEPEEIEENLAAGEEMQVDRCREQPDPEELQRRAAEASADAAGARTTTMGVEGPASAEPRLRIREKRPARPEQRREEQRDGGGGDPDGEEPPTRRQRLARAAVRLRFLVAMTGKTDDDQCWGSNVVYDGGGFCDECVTELQEQSVQDDVRLASYAAELAGTVGAAGEGETRETYHVVAGPSLDHRDDVEQLMGHQAVAYVTKILNTNEAILTESGRRESLKEYFILREEAVLAPVELDSIESSALVAKGKLILRLKSIENDAGGEIKARLVALGIVLFDKHMSVRRDAALHDLWSPVASTAEARVVPARAAAYGRVTESIDLIAAFPQVVPGGNIKHYIIIPDCLKRVIPSGREHCSTNCDAHVVARSGRDFIMSFAGWLIMKRWLTVPEAPALHVLWHDGDDAGAIKRAAKAREYVVSEERVGRNVLVRVAETFSA